MRVVVFLGAPGAGKGTVAVRIAEQIAARHISTGAMLRESVKNGTPAGLEAKKYMDKGELVPDQVLIHMIDELLISASQDDLLIFDGFPRNESQAGEFEALAAKHNAGIDSVIYLDVPEAVILDRLGGRRVCKKCGAVYHIRTLPPKKEGVCDICGGELIIRSDDQPETIRHRLKVYNELTAPLVSMYEAEGKLRNIDGSDEADQVAERVISVLRG